MFMRELMQRLPAEDREAASAEIHPRGRADLAEEEHAHRRLDVPRVPRADGGGIDRARTAPEDGREEERPPLLITRRASKTIEQVLRLFEHQGKHALYDGDCLVQQFAEPLTPVQTQVLEPLSIPSAVYAPTR
jgi:hypothetical protein